MNQFNIRVYGICINEHNEVLVSNEKHNGFSFTKFPGGGLEFGEGTIDCLKREFLEEFNAEIEVIDLFYLTDFYQTSAFNKKHQLISIYYRFRFKSETSWIQSRPIDSEKDDEQLLWVTLKTFEPTLFLFPIDQKVAEMLLIQLNNK